MTELHAEAARLSAKLDACAYGSATWWQLHGQRDALLDVAWAAEHGVSLIEAQRARRLANVMRRSA